MTWSHILLFLCVLDVTTQLRMQVVNVAKLKYKSRLQKTVDKLKAKVENSNKEMQWKLENITEKHLKLENNLTEVQQDMKKEILELKNALADSVSKTNVQTEKHLKLENNFTEVQQDMKKEILELKNALADSVSKMNVQNKRITTVVNEVSSRLSDVTKSVADIKLKTDAMVEQFHCPSPPALINGAHVATIDGRTIGARAVYACEKDFMMCSKTSTLTCLESKQWDRDNFRCEQKRWTNVNSNPMAVIISPCGEFKSGMSVTIVATPNYIFEINVMDDVDDILLHISIRFKVVCQNCIILDTKINGKWLNQYKHYSDVPFAVGRKFTLVIKKLPNRFELFVNQRNHFTYHEQKLYAQARRFEMSTGLRVHSIEVSGP